MPRPRIRRHRRFVVTLALVAGAVLPASADDPPARLPASPEAIQNLEAAYPKAGPGKVRHVILLPALPEEEAENLKVEIVAGRTIDTDGVNRFRFGGEFREKDIPGWGFSFFEVDALPGPLSTRIAPPEGAAKERRFVVGPSLLVRYNSRLPIVVYTPEGVEVRFRAWRAEGEPAPAEVR